MYYTSNLYDCSGMPDIFIEIDDYLKWNIEYFIYVDPCNSMLCR